MSIIGDMLKRVTGRQPEQQKPKAEPAKRQAATQPRQPLRVTPTTGPAVPSPTARFLNARPEVRAVGEGVYNGTIPPRPGPLAPPTTAAQQPTQRPTENTPQPRPPGGPRPEPIVAAPGMGGDFTSARTPRQPRPTPPVAPAPAQQPAARKPQIKTFDQFIGASKPGHKL